MINTNLSQYKFIANPTLFLGLIILLLNSCMAPRNITNSAKVTPKGNVVFGFNMSGNISTQAISSLKDVFVDEVRDIANNDSIFADENLTKMNKAGIAYLLDPITAGTDFYIRYGIIKHLDVGFKIAGNAKAIDVQYQFLGPVGNVNDNNDEKFYGSIGIQYSSQKQELPSVLADIQDRLGYTFKRRDILVPVLFSTSFGKEEKYGSLSFGAAVNYTRIKYSSLPFNIYTLENVKILGIENSENCWAFGGFINLKLGYKYIYAVPALAVYRQNYGDYWLMNGQYANFKGWTIIPSIGIKVRIGKNSVK